MIKFAGKVFGIAHLTLLIQSSGGGVRLSSRAEFSMRHHLSLIEDKRIASDSCSSKPNVSGNGCLGGNGITNVKNI